MSAIEIDKYRVIVPKRQDAELVEGQRNLLFVLFRAWAPTVLFVVAAYYLVHWGFDKYRASQDETLVEAIAQLDPGSLEYEAAMGYLVSTQIADAQRAEILAYTATPTLPVPTVEPTATPAPIVVVVEFPTPRGGYGEDVLKSFDVPFDVTRVPPPVVQIVDDWVIAAGPSLDVKRFDTNAIMTARYSFYWPPLGGVNWNGDDFMANGEYWQSHVGYAVACPIEFPLGTRIRFLGQIYECMDRGEAIVFLEDGTFWIDFLEPEQRFPFWMLIEVAIDYP